MTPGRAAGLARIALGEGLEEIESPKVKEKLRILATWRLLEQLVLEIEQRDATIEVLRSDKRWLDEMISETIPAESQTPVSETKDATLDTARSPAAQAPHGNEM